MKKMKVAYLRVSTDEQAKNLTIETQRTEFILPYCKSHDITLDRFYEDNGVSSRIPVEQRPAGRELIKDAEAGRIETIYIWKVSRLARNLRMFLNLYDKLDKLDVKVVSITEPIPEGRWGRPMLQLHGLFAEIDYQSICEQLAAGRSSRAKERGYVGGPAAFGYRKIGEKKTADLAKDTNLLPGLETSPTALAAGMCEDCVAGKSDQTISDWLNNMGVPTSRQSRYGAAKTGKLSIWRPTSVGAILTNPILKGQLRQFQRHRFLDANGKSRLVKNAPDAVVMVNRPDLAIVSEDLWNRVQEARRARAKMSVGRPAREIYLLRGVLKCGVCGLNFIGRGSVYGCNGRFKARQIHGSRDKACTSISVRRHELEETVWADIDHFLANPGKVIYQLEQQMADLDKDDQTAADIAKFESKLHQLEGASAIALRQLTRGLIEEPQFDKEIESIKRDRATLEKRLAELRKLSSDQDARANALGTARSLLERLRDQAAVLTLKQKRDIVGALVGSVIVTPVKGQAATEFRITYVFDSHANRAVEAWDDDEPSDSVLSEATYHRDVCRREKPDSSAGSHPTRLATEEGPLRDDDSRLQAQRDGHAICRPQRGRRYRDQHVR